MRTVATSMKRLTVKRRTVCWLAPLIAVASCVSHNHDEVQGLHREQAQGRLYGRELECRLCVTNETVAAALDGMFSTLDAGASSAYALTAFSSREWARPNWPVTIHSSDRGSMFTALNILGAAVWGELSVRQGRASLILTHDALQRRDTVCLAVPDIYSLDISVRTNAVMLVRWFADRGVVLLENHSGHYINDRDSDADPTIHVAGADSALARALLVLNGRGYAVKRVARNKEAATERCGGTTLGQFGGALDPWSSSACRTAVWGTADAHTPASPFSFLFERVEVSLGPCSLEDLFRTIERKLNSRGTPVCFELAGKERFYTTAKAFAMGTTRVAYVLDSVVSAYHPFVELWPGRVVVGRPSLYAYSLADSALAVGAVPLVVDRGFHAADAWTDVSAWFASRGVFLPGRSGAWWDPATGEAIIVAPRQEVELARQVVLLRMRGYEVDGT